MRVFRRGIADEANCVAATVSGSLGNLGGTTFAADSIATNAGVSTDTTLLNNFAAMLDTSHRKTALGIAQIVMLSELAVNKALDNVVPAG